MSWPVWAAPIATSGTLSAIVERRWRGKGWLRSLNLAVVWCHPFCFCRWRCSSRLSQGSSLSPPAFRATLRAHPWLWDEHRTCQYGSLLARSHCAMPHWLSSVALWALPRVCKALKRRHSSRRLSVLLSLAQQWRLHRGGWSWFQWDWVPCSCLSWSCSNFLSSPVCWSLSFAIGTLRRAWSSFWSLWWIPNWYQATYSAFAVLWTQSPRPSHLKRGSIWSLWACRRF